jgi:hypothetical protein
LKNIVHGDSPRFNATIEDEDITITSPIATSVSTVMKIMKKVLFAGFWATRRDESRPPWSSTARRRSASVIARFVGDVVAVLIFPLDYFCLAFGF